MTIPKVFISYSHDSQDHKKWVLELASRLRNNGIDAILDQFELQPGDDIPHFVETHLISSRKILMICSEKYVEKANKGEGGVGYEKMIITANLLKRIDENKVIPIIRQVAATDVPTFLKSKLYINFSQEDDYEFSYDELVRTIHNSPLFSKPAIGNNPFVPIRKEKLNDDIKLINSVLKGIALVQGVNSYIESFYVTNKLNISGALFRVAVAKLNELGYTQWHVKPSSIKITDKGLQYAFENGLLE